MRRKRWQERQDSNPRPSVLETDALTRLSYAPMHKIINKVAYKPSSVLRDYGVATIYLACTLPDRSSGQPGYGPEPYIPLLGLAPNGVYLDQECLHPCGWLLPHHFTLTDMQRYISVALSVGSPRPAVSGHPARWSSDFPPSPQPTRMPEANENTSLQERRSPSHLALY